MKKIVSVVVACLALTACAYEKPGGDPVVSPKLDSGITSSNGGGQRALGNEPNISVGGGKTTIQRSNNTPGSAY